MGGAPSNAVERGKWNKGLAALRESGATPDEIAARCVRYRERYGPSVALNPMALAGNWIVLAPSVAIALTDHPSQHVLEAPYANAKATPYAVVASIYPVSSHAARAGAAVARVPFAGQRRSGGQGAGGASAPRVGSDEYYDAYERRAAAQRASAGGGK